MGKAKLVGRQFVMEWKLLARDPRALFWIFAFPLLLLGGFGLVFRPGKTPALTVVRVATAPRTPADEEMDRTLAGSGLQVLTLSRGEAEARWGRSQTALQLERVDRSYRLRMNAYLLAQGQAAASRIQEAHLKAQARRQGVEALELPVAMETPGHAMSTSYVAFLLPGLLGMNLLSMGLFSVGMVNVSYREKGKFRRLAVTPLPKWIFLMGQILSRLTLTGLQSALMLVAGALLFGVVNQGSYLALVTVMTLGTVCFMAMGFALSSLADTEESYAALSNVFFFPMMLLSGVYFTLDSAPHWLQSAVLVLPLSPYLLSLRSVFNDGASMALHGGGLLLVAAWAIAAFLFAVRRFRWA
jgi:ABC-type multidrug transport system permease subunit